MPSPFFLLEFEDIRNAVYILRNGYLTRILHALTDFSFIYPFVNTGMAIITFFYMLKGDILKALSLHTRDLCK